MAMIAITTSNSIKVKARENSARRETLRLQDEVSLVMVEYVFLAKHLQAVNLTFLVN